MDARRIGFALVKLVAMLLVALSCVTQAQAQVSVGLSPGWNLLGNSNNASITVATTFGNPNQVWSVWKWNPTGNKWAFYTPTIADGGAAYAAAGGYDFLTSIGPKEGYWVNSTMAWTASMPAGAPLTLAASDLQQGWNLVSSADGLTPSQLNLALAPSLIASGKEMISAWSWDASAVPSANWELFARSLEAQGGTALSNYITSQGYLEFTVPLTAAEGFWINIGPVTSTLPGAPAIGTATAGNGTASVTFNPPASNGGAMITSYTVTSNLGDTATGAGSPITVIGLTNGTPYTFTVVATNSIGTGPVSAASNSVTTSTGFSAPTLTFAPKTVTFGATGQTMTATSNSAGAITYSSGTLGVATINATTGALTILAAGTSTITANQAAAGSFTSGSTSATLTVTTVAPTLTLAPKTVTLGATGQSMTASSNSLGAITYSSGTPGVATINATTGALTIVAAGTSTITANQAAAGNYTAAGPVTATLTVTATPTLTLAAKTVNLGATGQTMTATSNSSGTITYSSSNTSVATIVAATGALTILTVGTAIITANQVATTNYSAATAAATLTVQAVAPGAPTIGTATAGDAQVTVTFSPPASSGGAAVTGYTVTSNPGGITATGAASPIAVPGLANLTPYTFTVTATNSASLTGAPSAASNSATPIPTSVPVACAASAGSLALSMTAARNSGVAPLAVFFDATGTTSAAVTSRPFHDIEYRWNFGDAAGSPVSGTTWANGARPGVSSRNSATGPVAAHVFETPGTYTVAMQAVDGTNTASCNVQITVHDPEVVYAGDSTVCISAASDPTPGAGGCPAGAAHQQVADFCSAVTTHKGTGTRVLFNRAETFACAAATSLSANGPWTIGAYGSGAAPQISSNQATNTVILVGNTTAGIFPSDGRIMDLEITGSVPPPTNKLISIAANGNFDRLTILRLYIHDIGDGPQFVVNYVNKSGNTHVWDQLALVDNTIQTITGGGGTHGVYAFATRFSLLGNLFDNTIAAEHLVRLDYLSNAVVSNNTLTHGAQSKETMAIRGTEQNPAGPTYSAFVLPAPSPTQNVVVSDNNLSLSDANGLQLSPANSTIVVNITNVISERNYYNAPFTTACGGGLCAQNAIATQANGHTIRNEIVRWDNFKFYTFVNARAATTGMPAANDINIYNNSAYSSLNNSGAVSIAALNLGTSNIKVKNNLAYVPLATGTTYPVFCFPSGPCAGFSTLDQSNNSTGSAGGDSNQMRLTSPNFTATPPVLITDWKPTGTSYAIGVNNACAGAPCSTSLVPVWSDFFGAARTGIYDMGAVLH